MVYITTQLARTARLPELGPRPLLNGPLRLPFLLSSVAATLAFIASAGGLWFGGQGLYDPDPYLLPQLYGQDAMTLGLALPLLLFSMHLARRGSARALLLWTGLLLYLVYSYFFYVIDVRFNALFLVYIGLVSTSGYALAGLLANINPYTLRDYFRANAPVRPIAVYLIAVAVLFATMWIGDVLRSLDSGEPLGRVPRLVYIIDLAVVLPAMALAGIWLWQQKAWGYTLAGLLLVKVSALGLTLLVNTAIALLWQQEASAMLTAAFALLTLGGLAGSAAFLRACRA